MKFFIVFISLLLNATVFAETVSINWYKEDQLYQTTTCEVGNDLILPTAPTKRGHTFVGWDISRYTQVEYIESSGTAYIDTGIGFMFGDEFFIDYMHTGILSGENKGYGAGGPNMGTGNNGNSVITGGGREVSNKQQMWVINSNYAYSPAISLNNLLNVRTTEHWKIDSSTKKLSSVLTNKSNGNTYTLTSSAISTSYTSGGSVCLFRDNYAPWANPSKMRVYRAWLKRMDGTVVFDLIPVVDLNNVPCMYDTVSDTFLYNAGTGDFSAPGV